MRRAELIRRSGAVDIGKGLFFLFGAKKSVDKCAVPIYFHGAV
jgi:hypothetical protein